MDLDQKEWVAQKDAHRDAVVLDVRTQEEYDEEMKMKEEEEE